MPPSFTEIIGADVAKATVVVATHGQRQTQELANTPAALRAWLSTLPAGSAIAVNKITSNPTRTAGRKPPLKSMP